MDRFWQAIFNGLGRFGIPVVALALLWATLAIFIVTSVLGGSFLGGIMLALLAVPFYFAYQGNPGLRTKIQWIVGLAFIGAFLTATGIIPLNVRKSVSSAKTGVASNVAGTLNRVGLRSEGSAGSFDTTTQSGVVYASPNGTAYSVAGREVQVSANQKVRLMTPGGSPISENGMTQIMLRDSRGDFVSGIVVWIPNNRLKLQTFSLKGAFGKEEVRWEGVAERNFTPDQPWKTVFTDLPAGEYRLAPSSNEYQLFVASKGRTFYRRVRLDGAVLNDANQWTKHRAGPKHPVPEAYIASLIYRVGESSPRSYQQTFMVGEGKTADVDLSVDVPHDNARNFTENRGNPSVRLERRVTS